MRVSLMGAPVDILTMPETVDLARKAMRERARVQHVALNVAKLVNMRADPVLAADVAGSDIVGVDGMGILFALRLMGLPARERVAGIDLFLQVIAVCASEGFRPYLLGAEADIVEKTVATLRAAHPTLKFAGYQHGHFKPEEEAGIIAAIRNSGADCLFIGMPTPRKERLLANCRDTLGVPFIMGVGGSFDVVAGKVRRAPAALQATGFEWLFRVCQEPQRLWWRYAKTNAKFAFLLVKEVLAQKLRRAGQHPVLKSY